jgi:glyoxylase-like metal-dependent hydrolase (beta-lactamase superfamily II)
MVPMPGHTRGHTAIAVDAGHRWVLHCGDAFYHPGTIDGQSRVPLHPARPRVVLAIDRKQVHDNHERLAELHRRQEPDLLVVCSHNPTLFAHARDCA